MSIHSCFFLKPHKYTVSESEQGVRCVEMQAQTSQIVFHLKASHNIVVKHDRMKYPCVIFLTNVGIIDKEGPVKTLN